jgi:hypothetical protein
MKNQKPPQRYQRLSLFQQGQDLPLFTGQPDQAKQKPADKPKPKAVQLSLF